ncbi:MAG: hypothetical protein MHM6MM_001959 [Cercozoa sp. M6MM]
MSMLPDAVEREMPENSDLSSFTIPIQAHDLKNGQWVIADKSGLPGIVSDVKMSKTGKHGHAKFTYRVKVTFSGKSESSMHPGGDRLTRPVMDKEEYEVINYEDGEVTLITDEGEEKVMPLDEEGEVGQKVKEDFDNGEVVIVTVLVGPQVLGDDVKLIEMITSAKTAAN